MKIFPSHSEKLITFSIIAFVVGLAIGLMADLSQSEVTTSILTLLAAFLGAHYAFTLHTRRANQELHESMRAQGNLAVFNVSRIYNSFLAIRRQFIDPYRDSQAKHFDIKPAYDLGINVDFNFDKLAFLFNSKDPNVLGEINTLHNQVSTTLSLMKQRSVVHSREFQPALEAANLSGDQVPLEKVEEVIGPRITNTLKIATEDMIEAVDDIVWRSEKVANDLNKALVGTLGTSGVVRLKPVENVQ